MFCLVNSLLLILLLSHFSIVAVSRWTFWFLKDSSETYGLWPAQLLCAKSPPSWAQQRSSSCHCYNGGWSPGAISLFANDLSTVISGIYCGIRAAALSAAVVENKFQSIIPFFCCPFKDCDLCTVFEIIFSKSTTYQLCQHNKNSIKNHMKNSHLLLLDF